MFRAVNELTAGAFDKVFATRAWKQKPQACRAAGAQQQAERRVHALPAFHRVKLEKIVFAEE